MIEGILKENQLVFATFVPGDRVDTWYVAKETPADKFNVPVRKSPRDKYTYEVHRNNLHHTYINAEKGLYE